MKNIFYLSLISAHAQEIKPDHSMREMSETEKTAMHKEITINHFSASVFLIDTSSSRIHSINDNDMH